MAHENKGSKSRKRKAGAPQDTGGKKRKTETKVAKQAKARKVTAATARKTLSKNDKGKKQAKVSKQKNKGTKKIPAKAAKPAEKKAEGTKKIPVRAAKPEKKVENAKGPPAKETKTEENAEGTKKIPAKAAKPEKKFEIVLKEGVPKDEELEGLGRDISDQWLTLGRRLKVEESKLQAIDKDFDSLQERGFQMLKHWRQKEGSGATYKALSVALKNKLLQRKDLAEKYCWKRQYSYV